MIEGVSVADLTAPGLLLLLVLMLFLGWVVTKREADDIRRQRDLWQASAKIATEQTEKLLKNSDLTVQMLRSLTEEAKNGGRL